MDALMQVGHSREAAARLLAEELAGQPIMAGVSAEPWRAVDRWRYDVLALNEKRTIDDLPPEAEHARLAVGGYNLVTAAVRERLASGRWSAADVEAYARLTAREGAGMRGGAPHSELAWAKSEEDQG
jgi:hypothetical protein